MAVGLGPGVPVGPVGPVGPSIYAQHRKPRPYRVRHGLYAGDRYDTRFDRADDLNGLRVRI